MRHRFQDELSDAKWCGFSPYLEQYATAYKTRVSETQREMCAPSENAAQYTKFYSNAAL
jgi:hypothetical protein